MRNIVKFLAVPALVLTAACSGKDDSPQLDDALRNDLALASSVQPYQQQQYMSPMEMGYAGSSMPVQRVPAYGGQQGVYQTSAPAPRRASAPVYRAPSSAGTRAAEPIRNTKRDAILGASAGAVIGAVTSRDKLKGAVIGAAAGGLLGAVVGREIDIKRP